MHSIPQLIVVDGHHTRWAAPDDGGDGAVHVFDQSSVDAVNAALATGRPLLVAGEPGVGKSQLARAVAHELGWPLAETAVDSRTEASDLLWRFDAVGRIAEAQLQRPVADRSELRKKLAERRFIEPGPLWWAFNWREAEDQLKHRFEDSLEDAEWLRPEPPRSRADRPAWQVGQGCVVLIDEIDKADPDIPNGLLQALGDRRFSPPGCARVEVTDEPPLVFLTTNGERALPDAFIRRCLVLRLELPVKRPALTDYLVAIGKAHFPNLDGAWLEAANLLINEREAAASGAKPGLAEYIDLLCAVRRQSRSEEDQLALLDKASAFICGKYRNVQNG